MLAKVLSTAVIGLEGRIVEVEVDIAKGLPAFTIVGLPDAAVNESRERVRAAIKNAGGFFPLQRITVNLAPADLRKEGPSYDLSIAVGLLAASGQVQLPDERVLFIGELGLDGAVRHTTGILPMVMAAKEQGIASVYLPEINSQEASLIPGLVIYPVRTITQLVKSLQGEEKITPQDPLLSDDLLKAGTYEMDMKHIKGQEQVKRALELAAAGGHNVKMSGPPGAGKTMLARTVSSVLPTLTIEEAIEVTKIYSVAGLLPTHQALITQRPFRSPHHTTSGIALVGGGKWPKPGEISLAHRGVLFLDEFPEFSSQALEALRQPLEDGIVSITRVQGSVIFPAKFMLIAAMNPCPCGHFQDTEKDCTCSPSQISRYQKRLSGPLLDRIDIHSEVPRVPYEKLSTMQDGESSAHIRERVENARKKQLERFVGTSILCNAEMGAREIKQWCVLNTESQSILHLAVEQMHLSARSYHRVLKLARTIADIEESETILTPHVAEALQYRMKS